MKNVFIVGAEGPGSGMWDWFNTKENADRKFALVTDQFKDLPGEIIYRGNIQVPEELTGNDITKFVEDYLMEHGFENSFVNPA